MKYNLDEEMLSNNKIFLDGTFLDGK